MKNFRPLRDGSAFTLIELLVVISIIALLATLSVGAAIGVLKGVKKVQARNDMTMIVTALGSYYSDYGRYPAAGTAVTGTNDATYGNVNTAGNEQIINILRYPITPPATTNPASGWADPDTMNPRQNRYLEVTDAKVQNTTDPTNPPKNGILRSTGAWFDPWGYQYVIFIDGDYLGDITWNTVYNNIGSDTTGRAQVSAGAASVGLYNTQNNIAPTPTAPSVTKHNFDKQYDLISWQ